MNLWEIYHEDVPDFLRAAAETPPMQRLREVGMNCGCEYTSFPLFRDLAPYSRFDHSLGVGLIVWHFTHDKAQALAGLLHDIATPAFAHVIDFLHGDHLRQESTESGTEEFINGSEELQRLLETLGLCTADVADYHRYPVADNDSPRLSADRLEYTLGNLVNYGFADRETVKTYYDDLLVGVNGEGETELMFRTPTVAKVFAEGALRCSAVYVAEEDRYAMQMLAELLKEAIARGVLAEELLRRTEREVIAALESSPLAADWRRFRAYHRMERSDAPGAGDNWRQIGAKKRCIDPYVVGQGRVSALYADFREQLNEFLSQSQDEWLRGE